MLTVAQLAPLRSITNAFTANSTWKVAKCTCVSTDGSIQLIRCAAVLTSSSSPITTPKLASSVTDMYMEMAIYAAQVPPTPTSQEEGQECADHCKLELAQA